MQREPKQSKSRGFLQSLKRPKIAKKAKGSRAKWSSDCLALKHNDSLEFLSDKSSPAEFREGMDLEKLLRTSHSTYVCDIPRHGSKTQMIMRRSSKSLKKLCRRTSSSRSMVIDTEYNDGTESRGYVNKAEMQNSVWDN